MRLLKHIIRCYLRLSDNSRVSDDAASNRGLSHLGWPAPLSRLAFEGRRIHLVSPYLPSLQAREALRQCLPDLLRDPNFTACLKDDVPTRRWLVQLLSNVTGDGTQRISGSSD